MLFLFVTPNHDLPVDNIPIDHAVARHHSNHSDVPQDHTPLTVLTQRNRARNHDIVSSSSSPSRDPVLNSYYRTCFSSQDVEVMNLPSRSVGFITGHKGEGLRTIEGRTGTFIFTNASDRSGDTEEVRLS